MADIGDPQRHIEIIPLTEPATTPAPVPVPDKEGVPA